MGAFTGHTVEKGVLRFASVSGVKLFDAHTKPGCPRRWFRRYVLGEHEPETDRQREAKASGITLDTQLKRYLHTGGMAMSALAIKGLHILDLPQTEGVHTDVAMHRVSYSRHGQPFGPLPEGQRYPHDVQISIASDLTAGDVPFVGELDILNLTGRYRDDDGGFFDDPPGTVEVADLKWKGVAKDRYGNSTFLMPNDLVRDIQMAGYGEWARRVYPNATHVRLSHLYFPAKGALPTKVTKLHVIDEPARTWEYVNGLVTSMKQVAKETDIEHVDGAPLSSCDAYSGCPYRATCSAYKRTSLDNLYGRIAQDHVQEQQMGIIANNPQIMQNAPVTQQQLAQEEAQLRAQAAQQQQTVEPLLAVCQRLGTYGFGFPSLAGNAAQAYAAAGGQAVPPGYVYQGVMAPAGARRSFHGLQLAEVTHIYQLEAELRAEAAGTPSQVPPAPQPQQPQYTTPQPGVALLAPGTPESMPQLAMQPPKGEAPAGIVAPAPAPSTTPTAPPEAPKKRGRPPKTQEPASVQQTTAVPGVLVAQPQGVGVATPPSTAQPTALEYSAPEAKDGGAPGRPCVLINARAEGLNTQSLAGYVDYINETLAKRYNVGADGKPGLLDVRAAMRDTVLFANGWKGAVREIVKADPPPEGHYHLDTCLDELKEIVADALRVVASQRDWLYVRGVRL